jgi:hypothetical protein
MSVTFGVSSIAIEGEGSTLTWMRDPFGVWKQLLEHAPPLVHYTRTSSLLVRPSNMLVLRFPFVPVVDVIRTRMTVSHEREMLATCQMCS